MEVVVHQNKNLIKQLFSDFKILFLSSSSAFRFEWSSGNINYNYLKQFQYEFINFEESYFYKEKMIN